MRQAYRRLGTAPVAVGFIKLVVVGSTTGMLLVSSVILLSQEVRQGDRAAVCASRLAPFGQASQAYQRQFGCFAPCDPHRMMYRRIPGVEKPRLDNSVEKMDPAHGWLALYAMGVKPEVADQADKGWKAVPFGFNRQSKHNPQDLWEGFFCPSQNLRNTSSKDSPELDPNDVHEVYPVHYKYAAGYMVNRLLRSPTTTGKGPGTRWPTAPDDAWEPSYSAHDNIYGACVVGVDGGSGPKDYHVQAIRTDELAAPAETMYMCDSLDYHAKRSEPVDKRFLRGEVSAGLWHSPYSMEHDPLAAVMLGARHLDKANVLYADGHVSRDNQIPRNRRGDRTIASTFADYSDDQGVGSQHHIMPCGRKFGRTATAPATQPQ